MEDWLGRWSKEGSWNHFTESIITVESFAIERIWTTRYIVGREEKPGTWSTT